MRQSAILLLATLILLAFMPFRAAGQIIIVNRNALGGQMSRVTATVVDSLTNEPVNFASVYLIPAKDTTITNFTLSDQEGKATLEDVPYGNYTFHIEMLGYKPFVKEKWLRSWREDFGTVRLQIDENFISAAVVSDIGNPIVIKKDTIEFNASSYSVGANDMLRDLLRRMPGMEVGANGKVKFNGENIDKLTVGGRTFFFGDQSMALDNLPASVVDKIRVIDRESENSRASGIDDGKREKVLDVSLKKEYEKGWFGNARANAGANLFPDKDDPLRANRGALYGANALLSAYGEKDQVTVIADGRNIDEARDVVIIGADPDLSSMMGSGVTGSARVGINYNTSRIKDLDNTLSVNYNYNDHQDASRSRRTTFQDEGDLVADSGNNSSSYTNHVTGNVEIKKEKGAFVFTLVPSIAWNRVHTYSDASSRTTRDEAFVNDSESRSDDLSETTSAGFGGMATARDLGGKKGRVLQFTFNGGINGSKGHSSENSLLRTALGDDVRALGYQSKGNSWQGTGSLMYGDKLGEKLTLSATAAVMAGRNVQLREAFDAGGHNDYYSSESSMLSISQSYSAMAQYKLSQSSHISLGMNANCLLNEAYSRSFGMAATTGKDQWNWFFSPTFNYRFSRDSKSLSFHVNGSNTQVQQERMLPTLNISNPANLTTGNIYLKPGGMFSGSVSWHDGNREKFSTLMVFLSGNASINQITDAYWYDRYGIRYSVPVNTRKPAWNVSLAAAYNTPLDARKAWTISLGGGMGVSSGTNYQASGTLEGMDKDKFDYPEFMRRFWGDESGSAFYSGESGFRESTTTSFRPRANVSLRYNGSNWDASIGTSGSGRFSRYSLDKALDINTGALGIFASGSYKTAHEFEFKSDITYQMYFGYAKGYGEPEAKWNAEISKSIGPFNLSLSLRDILDSTRSLSHTVTANFAEDSYRLVMGRHFLFGVRWNFGKMNAANNLRAMRAGYTFY